MHFEMEDLVEQANEIQESLARSYAVPDELDEADLEAGKPFRAHKITVLTTWDQNWMLSS